MNIGSIKPISVYDELCSIETIFSCKIIPNIYDPSFVSLYSQIKIPLTFQIIQKQDVKLLLLVQVSELYPHDIPNIQVEPVIGVSPDDINNLTELIRQHCISECGKTMIISLVLSIKSYFTVKNEKPHQNITKPQIVKGSQAFLNSSFSTSDSDQSNSDIEISQSLCITDFVKNTVILNSLSDMKPLKFNLSHCVRHHCGICLVKGHCIVLQEVYSFHIWKFPKIDRIQTSLLNVAKSIDSNKVLVHQNFGSHPKPFVLSINNEIYFFLGTPLFPDYHIPLCNFIEKFDIKISDKTVHSIIIQILNTLHFLHSKNIVYGCLFPCNIMIGPDLSIKILDHRHILEVWNLQSSNNSSKLNETKLHHFHRFKEYIPMDKSGDIFNFGLIILSLCYTRIYDTLPIEVPETYNQKFDDFLKRCLKNSIENPLSTKELLNHPYIVDYKPSESDLVGDNSEDFKYFEKQSSSLVSDDLTSRLMNEYEFIEKIGKGGFGVVITARNKMDGCVYAIKQIRLKLKDYDERAKIIKEIKILSRMNHPNIVRYYNSWVERQNVSWFQNDEESEEEFSDDEESSNSYSFRYLGDTPGIFHNSFLDKEPSPKDMYIYLQMEYLKKKSLREIIEYENLFDDEQRLWDIFRNIASALHYIHSFGIIHRDIKPENILILNNEAKIIDFNLATVGKYFKPGRGESQDSPSNQSIFSQLSISRVGTFSYKAPEMNEKVKVLFSVTNKVDMYSFGIVFFEMCHPPFKTQSERYYVLKDIRDKSKIIDLKNQTKISIIEGLTKKDPSERLSAHDLLTKFQYPVSVDDCHIDQAIQHISYDPYSSHSLKLLKTFFEHNQKSLENSCYLRQYLPITSYKVDNFYNCACVHRYLDQFILKRGCITPQSPLFKSFYDNQNFEKQKSLSFIDSNGSRLSLSSNFLTDIFQIVKTYKFHDLLNFPVSRFGGIYEFFVDESFSEDSHHPTRSSEFYYSAISLKETKYATVCECISESLKALSVLNINISGFSYPEDIDNSSKSIQSFVLHINHAYLLIEILRLLKIKDNHIDLLLRKLSEVSVIDDLDQRLSDIKTFLENVDLKSHTPILLKIFSFRNNIEEFVRFVEKNFKTLNFLVNKYLKDLVMLFSLLRVYLSHTLIDVVINFGLFSCHLGLCDDIFFQILGSHNEPYSSSNISIITNGGIFKFCEENSAFGDSILSQLNLQDESFIDPQNTTSNVNEKYIAYSSTNCKYFVSLSKDLHQNNSCLFTPEISKPLQVILCGIEHSYDHHFIARLHLSAESLRTHPYNFIVYVYNNPIKFDDIWMLKQNSRIFNIGALVCFMPRNTEIKVFITHGNKNHESCFNSFEKVAWFLKNEYSDEFTSPDYKNYPSNSVKIDPNLKFIYLNSNQNVNFQKSDHHKQISQQLSLLLPRFNIKSVFAVYVVRFFTNLQSDLNDKEFSSLISEITLDNSNSESSRKGHVQNKRESKINSILNIIEDHSRKASIEHVYFVYNIQTKRLKPLL